MIRGLRLLPAIAGLLAGCGTHEVHRVSAENYPMKPVRLIEPFGAGGGPDLIARTVADIDFSAERLVFLNRRVVWLDPVSRGVKGDRVKGDIQDIL